MAVRRVDLVLPELPSDAVLGLAHTLQVVLADYYKVRLRLADEDGGEYVDSESTPVDFRPTEAPLVIRLGEGEPTLS
jgi:hypothetical protein